MSRTRPKVWQDSAVLLYITYLEISPELSYTLGNFSKVAPRESQTVACKVKLFALRAGETADELEVLAVLLVLRISEDTQALIQTALSYQSLSDTTFFAK